MNRDSFRTIRIKSKAIERHSISLRYKKPEEKDIKNLPVRPGRYEGMTKEQMKKEKERVLLMLSMPRSVNVSEKRTIEYRRRGLPLNSLPGWENIPLNLKLPMLKCPGNQVIFTKNKLGRDFKGAGGEFDLSTNLYDKPEYNPLHDTNLKNYYSREVNCVRLRRNGEITPANDVICTLKDFNAFRELLHKGHLYHLRQRHAQQRQAHFDHALVMHAQRVMNCDHDNLLARRGSHSVIMARKKEQEDAKAAHMQLLQQRTEDRLRKFYMEKYLSKKLLDHRKMLRQMDIERHWEIRDEILRKRFILLKKFLTIKKFRTERNLRRLRAMKEKKNEEEVAAKWQQRLNERITGQKQICDLVLDEQRRKRAAAKTHLNYHKKIWSRIQFRIKQRTLEWQMKRFPQPKVKKIPPPPPTADHLNYLKILGLMPHEDLGKALEKAVQLSTQPDPYTLPFKPEDPIYKAATFILKFICEQFKENMLGNKAVRDYVAPRVKTFLEETRCYVTIQATHLIMAAKKENEEEKAEWLENKKELFFTNTLQIVGKSSYAINPLVELKPVLGRKPTPQVSLTSIPVDEIGGVIEDGKAMNLASPCTLFLEYHLLKFKRDLVVALQRIVYQAITLHAQDKIMGVRRELLDIELDYLVDMVTNGLAGYAVNDLNFKSSLKLCISVISTQIIDELQKCLLKPKRDPRYAVASNQCCDQGDHAMLCLYCD